MPLKSGSSAEVRSENIAELRRSGYPAKQAEAIAYRKAGEDAAPRAAGILLLSPLGSGLFLKRSDSARDYPGTWCFPGGGIEEGETPEQAAKRETAEETGHNVDDMIVEADTGNGFVTYRGTAPGEFEPALNAEHTEYRWAPLESPPEPTHPGTAATLKRLLSTSSRRDGALDLREYDDNGWFQVSDNPLSKVGVYQYSEASIKKGGDPRKMVGVYRPAEELGSEECIKSFRLMPWTDDHPSTLLGEESQGLVPAEKKGVHGVIGEQTYFSNGTLYGNVKVFSEALARKIASGKRELSCGYHCDFIPQEGVFEGEAYQYVQRNMRGNHVSSVDRGRMGSEVRVLDAADAADSELAATTRFTFSLDMREATMPDSKRDDEMKDCVDADTLQFIGDSFASLVGELEKKGYSKEYATKIAGKVAVEKGATGHHDSTDKVTDMGTDTKTEEELKESADRKAARDSTRSARDALRAKDEMSSEEEEAEDAKECAEDAEEEKDDEKDETKEAKDRRSARDRRAGARDARKGARDRKSARDAAAAAASAKDKAGMDAAEITALVKSETARASAEATATVRKDAVAAQKLYQRLSPLVGAFDHDEMSHAQMAAYGLKKLGQGEAGDPVIALDYYLAGRATQPEGRQRSAQDSATRRDTSAVGRYINGAA